MPESTGKPQIELPAIPRPADKRLALRVTPAAERALRGGHPWLYADAIVEQSHEGQPGDLAVIFDRKRRFLAIGLYDPLSPIRVRVLQSGEPAPINADFYGQRLATAGSRRAPLRAAAETSGYRLIHGENDRLPGLVIDRYDRSYVVKLYTVAWIPHLADLLPQLVAQVAPERLVLRLSRNVAAQGHYLHGLTPGQLLLGPEVDGPVTFRENGIVFAADIVAGQKTGFFFDHRENRERVERLAAGQRTLNLFAYSGAFSLYAARGGAPAVSSVDLSEPALAAAARNFELNRDQAEIAGTRHELLAGDAFQVLADLGRDRRRFELVIIDPPTFARKQSQVEGALTAYHKLVRGALQVLVQGGTLVIASCTARITAGHFFETVHEAAAAAGRPLTEIERTGHPLDHPVAFPEGAYLKCLFARG